MQAQRPDQWRRLTAEELVDAAFLKFRTGWRVELPTDSVSFNGVDHLHIVIDVAFPNSQPRIFAPQAGSNYPWPHVEGKGLLCLKPTQLASDPGERVLQHLQWAYELLNYSEAERQHEFEREFSAYWDHSIGNKLKRPTVLSLLKPNGTTREVVYINEGFNRRIIVADDRVELMNWLRNAGSNPNEKDILPSWLFRLRRPWTPDQYPETGRDVLNLLREPELKRVLIPGRRCPFFFEARTTSGPTFTAVLLQGATKRELVKGFRGIARVPIGRFVASFNANAIQRCPVSRVDGPWVHGRDHDQEFPVIRTRTVAVIGCGALGAALTRLLAQSGVGKFLLVDFDDMTPSNVARHVLGMRYIGKNKAQATAHMLREDFPHVQAVTVYAKRFEWLTPGELEAVSDADLIISAGIDFDGDASLDTWRRRLSTPPAHLCTWVEAFAIVGHAVLLYQANSLLIGFDKSEQPIFRLTDWPEESNGLVVEAGCGNVFQPHGIVDLHSTVVLTARMAVDVLLGRVPESCRRVWQGDLEAVAANGGVARPEFRESNIVREFPWF